MVPSVSVTKPLKYTIHYNHTPITLRLDYRIQLQDGLVDLYNKQNTGYGDDYSARGNCL